MLLELFLILELLRRKRSLSFFIKYGPVLFIVLVGLVEDKVSISEHIVDELFKKMILEVQLKILSEDLISPEGCENFVSALSVFEFLVELIGTTCVGDSAVEPDKPKSEVLGHNLA